jgi:hypothetical protein
MIANKTSRAMGVLALPRTNRAFVTRSGSGVMCPPCALEFPGNLVTHWKCLGMCCKDW